MHKIIPFVGPPYAGKSTVLDKLRQVPVTPQSDVIFLSELATAFMKDWSDYLKEHDDPIIRQHYILRAQMFFEEFAVQQVFESGKNTLILSDRAVFDAYVYLHKNDAELMFGSGTAYRPQAGRYDHVIYFESTGIINDSNSARLENDQDSVNIIAQRTNSVWSRYYSPDRITYIPFFDNFDHKTMYVAEKLNEIFGSKIFEV